VNRDNELSEEVGGRDPALKKMSTRRIAAEERKTLEGSRGGGSFQKWSRKKKRPGGT